MLEKTLHVSTYCRSQFIKSNHLFFFFFFPKCVQVIKHFSSYKRFFNLLKKKVWALYYSFLPGYNRCDIKSLYCIIDLYAVIWRKEGMLSYLGKQTMPGLVWPLGDGLCGQGSSWRVLPVLLVHMHWGKRRACLPGTYSTHSGRTCFQRTALWSSLQMNLDPAQELESHSQRHPGKCLRQNLCLFSHRSRRYSSCCCCSSTWHKRDAKLHRLGRTLCKGSASRGWWAPTGFVPACPTGPSAGTHW